MKEAVYNWIKCLAYFYILLNMILHLVPAKSYERYVRFFMGLVLIVMLLTPFFAVLEKTKTVSKSMGEWYEEEEEKRLLREAESLQQNWLEKGIEEMKRKGWEADETVEAVSGEDGEQTMGNPAASGIADDSNRTSGIREKEFRGD